MPLPVPCAPLRTDEELQAIYVWVDDIPLSRPKRHITRDFSDGVLLAEIVRHFYPREVDLHNYSAANNRENKMDNWTTLNTKVLRPRLGIPLHPRDIADCIDCVPGAIEKVLAVVRDRVNKGAAGRPASAAAKRAPPGRIGYQPEPRSATSKPAARARPGSLAPPTKEECAMVTCLQEELDEMRDTVQLLSEKCAKLEHLVKIKNDKIAQQNEKIKQLTERGAA